MSILVNGMTMPTECRECRFMDYHLTGETWCSHTNRILAMDFKPIPYEGRPRWCPLVELPEKHDGKHLSTGEWLRMSDLPEKDDDRYKCSRCGNVVHYKSMADLYTFNSWCGRCGSDNGRHAPTVIEAEGEE